MSTLLYRLGRTTYDHPWRTIGAWAVLVAAVVGLLLAFPVRLSPEIRIDGTPAQQVIDDLAAKLPQASGGQGAIAFEVPATESIDSPQNAAAVVAAVDRIYTMPHVIDPRAALAAEMALGPDSALLTTAAAVAQASGSATGGPTPMVVDGQPIPGVILSADHRVALFQFQFDAQTFDLPKGTIAATVDAAKEAVAAADGIQVLPSATMFEVPHLIGPGEVGGVVLAAIVLLITLGSVVAGGLPLASALLGVVVGVGGAFTASHLIQMQSLTAVLALMLGLAVGIDYALFIVNRQRRLMLDQGLTASEAAARAIGTAGSAVVFAGTTVVIALTALLVVEIQMLTIMALVAAVTVAVAVAAALTFLPALLGLVGERICPPRARARHERHASTSPDGARSYAWGAALTRHRGLAVAAALAVATVVALPMASMELGLPSGSAYDLGTPQRASYDAITASLGPGYNGPLVVVASSEVAGQAIATEDVAALAGDLGALADVSSVSFGGMSSTGDTVVLSIVPGSSPTGAETTDLVQRIRADTPTYLAQHHLQVGVTGFTALMIDVADRLSSALPLYVLVVVALSVLVLLLVFRSVLVPIKATVGFLLSLFATLGATTAVFQWGWFGTLTGSDAQAPVLSLLPIIVTGVLYGLAMDYEVFLVSSMREAHVHGHRGRAAVARGFSQASRVVVAAALIMISVFAGFALNADPMVSQFGFALAFGILIDAFVVRLTLVPAVMAIFGDRVWWLPRWLDRLLPDLDIDGDRLATHLDRVAPPGASRQAVLETASAP